MTVKEDSFFQRCKQWFDINRMPCLEWIQVEVTSHCNAACIYCPRTVYQDSWVNRHITFETFKKITPYLAKARHLHLQGWGEPLLNPHFFQMLRSGKEAGCRVGTTTNGIFLTDEIIAQMIESRIDLIAFSLAGTDEGNDSVRKGTSIKKVLDVIKKVNREKKRCKASVPVIHIAYMVLRSGLDAVKRIPETFAGLGINDIVISTLDFVPQRELEKETLVLSDERELEALEGIFAGVAEQARSHGMNVHYSVKLPEARQPVCSENIHQALVIAADGAVSPCVYTNLTVGNATHFVAGEEQRYERMMFGNINDMTLPAIWYDKRYRHFREAFQKGALHDVCKRCPKHFK